MILRTAKLFLLFLCFSLPLTAQIIYVAPGATGNGTSWADAIGDFQVALQSANFGDQIWLASGTYYPILCNNCSTIDRNTAFEIPNGVAVYGGFSGIESSLSERDWENNPTILSGNIDQDNNLAENAFTIVYFENVDNSTVLDGCILQDGMAQDSVGDAVGRNKSGAAIYNMGIVESNPVIRNCRFLNNQAANYGGGIYNYGRDGGVANPEIRNCFFDNNHAVNSGGAIYNDAGQNGGVSSPLIANCYFQNNESIFGGSIYNNGFNGLTEPRIINSQFYNNTASSIGGACYSFSKGSGQANPKIINCIFSGNHGVSSGAVYSLANGGYGRPYIVNSVFYNNDANIGGAVYCNESDGGDIEVFMYNSIFWGNTALHNRTFHMSGNGTPTMNVINSIVDATSCETVAQLDSTDYLNCNNVLYNENPLFLNPAQLDFHLVESSPAVDAGDNQIVIDNNVFFDIDSMSRINNTLVDIGVFEFEVLVYIPTVITQQPVSQSLCEDDILQIYIETNGSEPSGYQWFKDGQPLVSANQSLLTITNIDSSSQGDYYVEISTQNGTILQSEIATVTITDLVTPMIEISSSDLVICSGESVVFSILNQNNQGNNPSYQWRKNGVVVSNNAGNYVDDNLVNGDQITCELNVTEECVSTPVVFSNTIIVEVVSEVVPSITVSASQSEACVGTSVFFSATYSNGGNNPLIEWFRNDEIIGQGMTTILLDDLMSTDMIQAKITSSADCATAPELSNIATVDIIPFQEMMAEITASTTSICDGESIDFTVGVENGNDDLTYQWMINGENVGNNTAVFSSADLENDDVVSCQVTSEYLCLTSNPVMTNSLTIASQPIVDMEVTVVANVTTACEGEEITFTATASNAGNNPTYQWMINGTAAGENQATFMTSSLNENDEVTCQVTSDELCLTNNVAVSASTSINFTAQVTPAVSVQANQLSICEGDSASFIAQISNGGSTPEIQWFLNEVAVGTGGLTLNLPTFSSGDMVSVEVVSSSACATTEPVLSTPISTDVNALSEVSISVESSADFYCEGDTLSFSAIAENEGENPVYQWLVNGGTVQNNTPFFAADNLTNSDLVTCRITSSEACITNNPEESESADFEILPVLYPAVTIEFMQDSICPEDLLFFTARLTDEGENPMVSWQINGQNIDENGLELAIDTLSEGDEIIAILEVEETCTIANEIISEPVIISFENCNGVHTKTFFDHQSIQVFPNPVDEKLFIHFIDYSGFTSISWMNLQGQLIKEESLTISEPNYVHQIAKPGLPSGTYVLRIQNSKKSAVTRIIVP